MRQPRCLCVCPIQFLNQITDFNGTWYKLSVIGEHPNVILSNAIIIMVYSPLLGLGRFFSFLSYTQSVGLLEWGLSPSQGRYLHTEQEKHRINAYTCMP
jgi:hypothetical protein